MKKNVLITGGTGFVGKQLTHVLLNSGYSVSILSRSERTDTDRISYYKWDVPSHQIDEEAVLHADYIIHLAGENLAEKRLTSKRKAAIIDSREQSAQLIHAVLKKNNKILDAFISASAVGIYGAVNGEEICTENMPAANDFLGLCCQKWEAAADDIGRLGIRTVKVRTALVLGKDGGLLNKMAPIFRIGLGAVLGSGKQYMPWIFIKDLCGVYLEAVRNPNMAGAYNAAINDNTTNAIFSKTLAKVYDYKIWLPNIPAFLIKMVLGAMANPVLTGRRASSDKIEALGFHFQCNNLEDALRVCLSR